MVTPQQHRHKTENQPEHDPGEVSRFEPVPPGQSERPEPVNEQENPPVPRVVLHPRGDARAEDEGGDEAEEEVEEESQNGSLTVS